VDNIQDSAEKNGILYYAADILYDHCITNFTRSRSFIASMTLNIDEYWPCYRPTAWKRYRKRITRFHRSPVMLVRYVLSV